MSCQLFPGKNQCIVSGVIGVSGASSLVSDMTNMMVDGDRPRYLYIRYYRLQRSNRPNSKNIEQKLRRPMGDEYEVGGDDILSL